MSEKFSTMYKIGMSVVLNKNIYKTISTSDIVSISFVNNYDANMFPLIRVRLYTDLQNIQDMLEYPDSIYIRMSMNGNIYMINDDNTIPVPVAEATPISFEMKGYIENKNIPTSVMDQYKNGLKVGSGLNENVKSPIEIYCYDEKLIHLMKQKASSIYKNMSIVSVISDMFSRNNILNTSIRSLDNQTKYDQILIPNLSITDAIAFLDERYGLYTKGGQMYGDYDKLYVWSSDVNAGDNTLPIYVRSFKNNADMTGMMKINSGIHKYKMVTNAPNVSVITETDIERVINSPEMGAINLYNMNIDIEELKKLYSNSMNTSGSRKASDGISTIPIDTPQLLHKNTSQYVLKSYIARLDEHITRIDVSGSGYDIGKMKMNSRYNVIFESPIRGTSIDSLYRATYLCHVLTNVNGDLFVAQTTMNLCSN